MQLSATEISDLIQKKIENFEMPIEAKTEGRVR
jgi:F0F1-type ATP synthase alpha subunit